MRARRIARLHAHLAPEAVASQGVPEAFLPESVRANSPREQWLYSEFHSSQEPVASLKRLGLTTHKDPVTGSTPNPDNDDHWYNTTGRSAEYWKDRELPTPTQDICQCRRDLLQWGYCLVAGACSPEQVEVYRKRLWEQAEGEKLAGVNLGPAAPLHRQNITTLANKGRCFEGFIEFDPQYIQGGPLIEQLLTECLGGPFIAQSLQAFIAYKLGLPQPLHQDQSYSPFQSLEAPMQVSAMVMISDVSAANGGTLLIPGSHHILNEAGSRKPLGFMPPAINCTAPSGTCLIFDARVLHGTGVNTTDVPRYVLNAGFNRFYLRTQENWSLSVSKEVLARASPKMLQRLGFAAQGTLGTVDGHGFSGSFRLGDPYSDVKVYRDALDAGVHRPVGVLSPDMSAEALRQPFTFRETESVGSDLGRPKVETPQGRS
mmetsp:Transcript_58700/g.157215  ORF Transcript_58700/g.157215 Transcript_58700/m.157215 type:complete len:430 (-) Transcript_58700:67-1356(-)